MASLFRGRCAHVRPGRKVVTGDDGLLKAQIRLMRDGVLGPEFRSIDSFLHHGADVSFVTYTRDFKKCAVIGGQASGPYDEIEDLTASPDGRHVAFRGRSDGRWHAVVDGRKQEGSHVMY